MTELFDIDLILSDDAHLIQSFADLDGLKQRDARTAIVGASGPYVTDSEGNRYIDGIAGLWCANVGHGRSEIIDAITAQLSQLDYYSTFYNFTHPTAAALARKLAKLAPGSLNRVYFSNSGSVANDSAVRILHHYFNRLGLPKKKKVLSRIGAYHGSTHLSAAMTTPAYRTCWDSAEALVHHIKCPHHYREGVDLTEAEFLELLIDDAQAAIRKIGPENIACFIAEPIMGAGGVIVPPVGYHAAMASLMRSHDIKYVSDEIVTSFCRLGHMFASEDRFDIQPDIITTAKGLTSGYQPLAATLISDEIYDVISRPGETFLHGMTYSGHPAAAAAALANIKIMETEQLAERVLDKGSRFETQMADLAKEDIVGEVRGSHFMMGIEFVSDKELRLPFNEKQKVGTEIAQAAQRRGLIARPLGSCMILSPTLIMDDNLIKQTVAILRDSIREVSVTL